MAVKLEDTNPDDILIYYYDTGAFGYTACFAKVIKVCKKKIHFRTEHGDFGYWYPEKFTRKASPDEFQNIIFAPRRN